MGNLKQKYTEEEWENLIKNPLNFSTNIEEAGEFMTQEEIDIKNFNVVAKNSYSSEDLTFCRGKNHLDDYYKIKEKEKNKGVKYSEEKAPMATMLRQFPLALEAVAFRSKLGHEKYKEADYDWMNFKRVPNAIDQYSDASVRHLAGIGDDEDDLGHLKAAAWNILATLQLILEEKK